MFIFPSQRKCVCASVSVCVLVCGFWRRSSETCQRHKKLSLEALSKLCFSFLFSLWGETCLHRIQETLTTFFPSCGRREGGLEKRGRTVRIYIQVLQAAISKRRAHSDGAQIFDYEGTNNVRRFNYIVSKYGDFSIITVLAHCDIIGHYDILKLGFDLLNVKVHIQE